MDSLAKSEPTLSSSLPKPSTKIMHSNPTDATHYSEIPHDSMKDMDWLNCIELKMLSDSGPTKTSCIDEAIKTTDSYYSSEQSVASMENDVFEPNHIDIDSSWYDTNNIRTMIDKIQAKNVKEKIDIQLLEKLTKILNVTPPIRSNQMVAVKENNENAINPSSTDDEVDSDPKCSTKPLKIESQLTNPLIGEHKNHKSASANEDVNTFLNVINKSPTATQKESVFDEEKLKPLDYKNDTTLKPPYSYSTLIKMAMKSNQKECITLLNIYDWIRTNFAYYRSVDSCWQNSIRHNLSLNKCFVRVPRESGDHGKGGYWKYVESNDTVDTRYSSKTYSRSLSTGVASLNCYRSKKYHRRNNKNLSVIVQPFDQFQPQHMIDSFVNNGSTIQNHLFSQFTSCSNNNNNSNNLSGVYGYQNPYVSPPTTNIYNNRIQLFSEGNPPSINNNLFQKLPCVNAAANATTLDLSTNYNSSVISNQVIVPNSSATGGTDVLASELTSIGSGNGEINPILEAMKLPLTYFNNLNQSTTNNHASCNETLSNHVFGVSGVAERDINKNLMDNTPHFTKESGSLAAVSVGESSNGYSVDLLNSLTAAQQLNPTTIAGISAYNNATNWLNDASTTAVTVSPGPEYKSLTSTINNATNASFDGNDLYNFYLNELGILQQQQQPQQQMNPQLQRLYNVLGGNNFHQL